MQYIVTDGSMVITGQKEDGTLLYTPVTPQTEPMLIDSEDEALLFAEKSGTKTKVWSEESYANGQGVVATGPKIGELRKDTVKRVCVNPCASYGGGSGELWAVEGQEAQLTLDAYPHGYIRGECVNITDDGQSISFRITNIMEEHGAYVRGAMLELPVGMIRRYDRRWY